MKPTILLVEDQKEFREGLEVLLKGLGFHVFSAVDGRDAIGLLKKTEVDILLSDVVMPCLDGISLLDWVLKNKPSTVVILLTAYGDIDSAVNAMKKGAYDYLTKPVDIPRLENTIKRAYEKRQLMLENKTLKKSLQENTFKSIVGISDEINGVIDKIRQYAPTDANILITGETGVGKDLIARAIHSLSPRSSKSLVKVSCAALPETLLESELFGFEKGSFTGAHHSKKGRFEIADGGTILLNEVESLTLPIQAKLLRIIEEKEFERIGGVKTLKADVRIISTANKDLRVLVEEGSFREDLYYRLHVLSIEVPPLRERRDDIPLLLHHYLGVYSKNFKKSFRGFTKEAIKILTDYTWPGNVRELQNLMESVVIGARPPLIKKGNLPTHILMGGIPRDEKLTFDPGTSLEEIERSAIQYTLRLTQGNKKKAAELLGIGLKTLYRKLSSSELSN